MNFLLESPATQGETSVRLPSTDEAQALSVARDAIADITDFYGFAPQWEPEAHYALMASIFTEPTAYAAA